MTKKIKWRLGDLPTPDELRGLVTDGLLSKEEAREILFSEQEEDKRDAKSLETEIKFLRELVERLSKGNQTNIVETIRYIEKPYMRYPWYQPYGMWCNSGTSLVTAGYTTSGINSLISGTGTVSKSNAIESGFSNIATF